MVHLWQAIIHEPCLKDTQQSTIHTLVIDTLTLVLDGSPRTVIVPFLVC